MYVELAAGAYLLGSYAYHRWFADDEIEDQIKPEKVTIPTVSLGDPITLIYGRCRVREPWLAMIGAPQGVVDAGESAGQPFVYETDLFYVIGVGMGDDANTRVRHVYVDDVKLRGGDLQGVVATGASEHAIVENFGSPGEDEVGRIGGWIEVLAGGSSQVLRSEGPPVNHTYAGDRMFHYRDAAALDYTPHVSSFRGYLSALLFGDETFFTIAGQGDQWRIGNSPNPGSYQFECHSYPFMGSQLGPSNKIGEEANPADVLLDLLTGTRCKAGVPRSRIDFASFTAAAETLAEEGNGYSRAVADAETFSDVVDEILRQIDGVLFEDPHTDTWKLKLVRPDYVISDLVQINPDNTRKLTNVSAGSRSNLTNKIRVMYTDRDSDYVDNSAEAFNQATAAGQNGVANEQQLRFPGVCTAELAIAIATRELSARSRPIAKCRAIVDRTLVRVNPGDAVRVTWPDHQWEDLLFRVAAVDRGTRDSSEITLDLVQEFYQNWRGVVQGDSGTLSGFPITGGVAEP